MEEKESLGSYLKREREARNISLREVSKNTKVKEYLLRAIEEDQYSILPPSTYVRGFILSYAKYIGLDPNEVLQRYEEVIRGRDLSKPQILTERKILWKKKYWWIIGGIIIIFMTISYLTFLHPSFSPKEHVSLRPKIEKEIPSPQTTISPPISDEQPFLLQLKAVEETWVRIQIDDQIEQEMTLKPGESTSHRALKRMRLIVGNAGGLEIFFKGKHLEKFGKSGEVVNLIFTPQGVEAKRIEKAKPKME